MGLIGQSSLIIFGITVVEVCPHEGAEIDHGIGRFQTMSAQSRETPPILGRGYVDFQLAIAALDTGWLVIGFDNLDAKADRINSG